MNKGAQLSPAHALMGLGVGHTVWGLVAYHDQLAGIVRDLPGAVGDGIFDKSHSRDARAAAFWFLSIGPLLAFLGRLYQAAEAAEDRPAIRTAGRVTIAIGMAGEVAIPRSGFPGAIAVGLSMLRRARR